VGHKDNNEKDVAGTDQQTLSNFQQALSKE